MTLLVPYDGSDLSRAALHRASEFSEMVDEPVLVLVVIPQENAEFARERGWIGEGEPFDIDAVHDTLAAEVADIAPDAQFRCETPDDVSSVADITTDVVRTIRNVAREVDASIVFIGSENAGRVSTPVTSVGAPVSEDPRYDVHIVRHAD